MPLSLRAAYRQRLDRGEIQPDPAQEAGLEALSRLEGDLNALHEPSFSSFFFRRAAAPRGVYLWGPVGRGKSMLMDLFFETAPIEKKRRDHFYAFMAEVHGLIDAWRKGDAAARRAVFGQHRGDDPIEPVAALIAAKARLLCFDELQVSDIADAMILGRLFEALFRLGVILVCTSNRAPDDLYQGGLNRQLFLPFVDMLKERLEIVRVAGARDFRLERLAAGEVYLSPITPETEARFDALWLGQLDGAEETGATLEVLGRRMRFPRASNGLVRASFASLCGQALGSQDYLALADRFDTLFLEAVPVLAPESRNEARRFVWLVDALYEGRAKLAVLAAAEPEGLYAAGDGAFEFERTVSRLHEMRSQAWLTAAPR